MARSSARQRREVAPAAASNRQAGGVLPVEIRAAIGAAVGDDGPELFIPTVDMRTVTDEASQVVGLVTSEQAAVITTSAAPLAPSQVFVVRALESFGDILTRRDYKPGDTVPWDRARAERYAARGLVEIIEDGVSE
jgi:hypothetical protein